MQTTYRPLHFHKEMVLNDLVGRGRLAEQNRNLP